MTSLLIVGILLLALLRTPLFVVMFLLAAVLFLQLQMALIIE